MPYLTRPGLSLTVSGSRWQTDQLTYDSKTYGGKVMLSYQRDRIVHPAREPVRYHANLIYSNEYLRYGIKPEFLDDQSRREERISLGLDPDTGRARGSLATIALDLGRTALDNAADPRLGTVSSLHVEFASPKLGGTYKYRELGAEARGFVPVGSAVLAGRVRASTIDSRDPLTVPFSERYFLGGSASLRGWGRFQVSPLDPDGLPVGGRSMLELSTELRVPVRGPLGAVLFVDGGNVWSSFGAADLKLRWDAGFGIRYRTPVGALRLDLGRQLTPIDGLVVNGEPSLRRWRLHFSLGHTF
jgi:outer membrane protein assembly factor BamA